MNVLDKKMNEYALPFHGEASNPYDASKHVSYAVWQPTNFPSVDMAVRSLGVKIKHEFDPIGAIMLFLSGMGMSPHWDQTDDTIYMLSPECFPSPEVYAATVLHELGHWTGHPSRTGRLDPDGIMDHHPEEATAEMFAVIMCDKFGILTKEVDERTTNYISDWATDAGQHLADIEFLHTAAKSATKAAEWLDKQLNEVYHADRN